jgi:hypothetical protein
MGEDMTNFFLTLFNSYPVDFSIITIIIVLLIFYIVRKICS